MVKNKIAAAPDINETELSLRNRLLGLFAQIEPRQLKVVWGASVDNCRDCWKIFLEELEEGAEDDEEESGDGVVEDSGESSGNESDQSD